MEDRREFLRKTMVTAGLAAAAEVVAVNPRGASPASEQQGLVFDREKMQPQGEWYEATVPDTLDLAKRAEFSVNVLTRNLEPNTYSVQGVGLPPKLVEGTDELVSSRPTWHITGKNLRALPWMRTMSGSEDNLEVEYNAMRTMVRAIHEDGQVFGPADGDGVLTSNPKVNGAFLLAMANWYERDGDPAWKDRIRKVSEGLQRIAVLVEDRAFYPLECVYHPDGTWHTERPHQLLPYTPPDEPVSDQQGGEGAVKIQNVRQLLGLVKDHELTGSRRALEMSWKLARFILKPGMWPDTTAQGYPSYEHGIFEGHFHANIHTLYMMTSLAHLENDEWLKQFVREGYDHGRRNGVLRMGWFPAWTLPVAEPDAPWVAGRRPQDHHNRTEGCGVADMLVLAVKLTDAGLGDYWDDADHIVRNQLAAQQFISLDLMRRAAGGSDRYDAVLSRFLGGFGSATPTYNRPSVHACCSANGSIGLYYAWHGITRFHDGIARVNLFLNRASSWMDVNSYLPYEGKVVLHNKQAHTAHVRVPSWVEVGQVRSFVNNREGKPGRSGRYLVFQNLKKNDQIRLEFPVPTKIDKYTIAGKQYTITLRGSTLVDIAPREEVPGTYPIFQRDSLKATKAPLKKVRRFAAKGVLPLQ